MTDNVAVTAGSGTTVATDDVGGAHYQKNKIFDATADSSVGLIVNAAGAAYVDPRLVVVQLTATSSGLTTSTTNYSDGDQVGTIFTLANAVRASGGTGTISGAVLIDKAAVLNAVDIYLWDRSVTLASDNTANGVSDSDALFCQGVIHLASPGTTANNRIASLGGIGQPFKCNATSLFASIVARATTTFFSSSTDLVLMFQVNQD